jgi:hypothetical protein
MGNEEVEVEVALVLQQRMMVNGACSIEHSPPSDEKKKIDKVLIRGGPCFSACCLLLAASCLSSLGPRRLADILVVHLPARSEGGS